MPQETLNEWCVVVVFDGIPIEILSFASWRKAKDAYGEAIDRNWGTGKLPVVRMLRTAEKWEGH